MSVQRPILPPARRRVRRGKPYAVTLALAVLVLALIALDIYEARTYQEPPTIEAWIDRRFEWRAD